jgi:hypothetical protein
MKLIFVLAFCGALQASQNPKPEGCPMHAAHTHAQVNERGEKGMGFSQTATTHHFYLDKSGRMIQVEVKESADSSNRDDIRTHLRHIAHAFRSADFDIPMFVHDTVPPGVPEMQRLRKYIRYAFEETPKGGRVVITSSDTKAIEAIHHFLRFQVEEHKTGDPTSSL